MGAALLSDRKLLAKWIAIIFVPIAIWLIPTNETFTADVRMFFVVTLVFCCNTFWDLNIRLGTI